MHPRRPRSGLPTLVALGVGLVLVTAWRIGTRDLWPPGGLESIDGEGLLWIEPRVGPIGTSGELEVADVIVVGDSRVGHGIHLSIASSLGIGAVATAWGVAAKTTKLLQPFLARQRPASLVVALSLFGLVGEPNLAITESMRERNAALDPENPPHVVRAWAVAERQHLDSVGFKGRYADLAIEWWVESHRNSRAVYLRSKRWVDTEGIDRRLSHRVDRARSLALNPIEPSQWRVQWWRQAKPRTSDGTYRAVAHAARVSEHEASARELESMLERLVLRGWRVACVRLPIDPTLRAIEDETGGAQRLRGIAEGAGVPYLDFGGWPDSCGDGSHLNWRAADRVTRELARWLKDDLGWATQR